MNLKKWKNWPYWFKGGITVVSVYILFIILILAIYKPFFDSCGHMGCNSDWIIILSGFPTIFIPLQYHFMLGVSVLAFFQYFLIGALIGYIYGKIKSKKYGTK